jgi:predicted protein tyrosine phosphatase
MYVCCVFFVSVSLKKKALIQEQLVEETYNAIEKWKTKRKCVVRCYTPLSTTKKEPKRVATCSYS